MSETTLHTAKRVAKHAAESVKELVSSGAATVADAAKVSSLPKEVQDEAAKKVRDGDASTLSEAAVGDAFEEESQQGSTGNVDMLGQKLPAHIKDAFGSKLFTDYLSHVAKLKLMTEAILKESPWFVGAAGTLHQLEACAERLRNAKPYALCVECKGIRGGCEGCRKKGWVPQWRHEEMMFGRSE